MPPANMSAGPGRWSGFLLISASPALSCCGTEPASTAPATS
jgi:hypothetical protein